MYTPETTKVQSVQGAWARDEGAAPQDFGLGVGRVGSHGNRLF